MKLEKLVEVDVYDAVDKAVAKAEKRVLKKAFTLLRQGYSLDEAEKKLGFAK